MIIYYILMIILFKNISKFFFYFKIKSTKKNKNKKKIAFQPIKIKLIN